MISKFYDKMFFIHIFFNKLFWDPQFFEQFFKKSLWQTVFFFDPKGSLAQTELRKVASTASMLAEPAKADWGTTKMGIHALNDPNFNYGELSKVE